MSYVQFLLIFLVAPSALLLALHGVAGIERLVRTLLGVSVAALIYFLPWWRLLIAKAIAFAPYKIEGSVAGIPWGLVAFVILQVFFVGSLTAIALRRSWWRR